ncbi:MAG: tetratricopeptide repeat protein [Terriglobales bacterium]
MNRTTVVAVAIMLVAATASAQQPQALNAAELYQSALNLMTGGSQTRDPIDGVSKLRESAKLGYAPAQTAMIDYADTPEEAAGFCRKAADQGDVLGEWCIGRAYFLGSGVLKDWSTAEKWLQKASEQGNPFAAYTLGLIAQDRDPKSAPAWFQKAAEQGLPQAQRKLGLVLKQGRSVATDKYHAYVWLLVSEEAGATAGPELDELESDLGTTTVSRAKIEARELARTTSRTATAHGCTGWTGEFDDLPALPPIDIQKFCR